MDFTSTLSRFEKLLEKKGRSKFTITAYKKDLEQLIIFLKKNKISKWAEANTKVLEKYFQNLKSDSNLKPKSISRKMNSTKTFYKFLISLKLIDNDYSKEIQHPKLSRNAPRVLTPLEYKALRDTARKNIRLYTLIETLLQTGIRIGEISRLEKSDIDVKFTRITIRSYSSYPERVVPINPVLQITLQNFLENQKFNPIKSKYVFFTRTGNSLSIRNIRSAVNIAFKKTGIKDATVNDLRNTFIIFQLENGLRIEKLAQIVGHKKQTTTEHYLEYISTRPHRTTNKIIPL